MGKKYIAHLQPPWKYKWKPYWDSVISKSLWLSLETNKQNRNAGEDITWQGGTVGENTNLYSHYGNCYRDSSRKLKIELYTMIQLQLLELYSEEQTSVYSNDSCILFFYCSTSHNKLWTQPRCLSIDGWIKHAIYKHNSVLAIKRTWWQCLEKRDGTRDHNVNKNRSNIKR